jgi:ABC-type glycerol-3-phosphate transport system substrate-binding protein
MKRRSLVAAAAVFAAAGVLGGAAAIRASDPSEQSASVPAAGQTTTITWTGTIPAGAHPTSDCSSLGDEPTVDHHAIHLSVP